MSEAYGTGRVIDPAGALPQPADRLDPSGPVREDEFEIAVERLCLDATSFRSIRREAGADPDRMADRVMEIVTDRGKMHNPETDSGGVALGTVTGVGAGYDDPPSEGDRIVTLASLTLTPLRIDEITGLDPDSAQIAVRGTAYVFNSAPWGPLPSDLPEETALEVYDVYGAGSHVARLAGPGDTVCVMGAGHAGKLAMAAAREVTDGGTVIGIDADPQAIGRLDELGLCDIGLVCDLRDPISTRDRLVEAGAPEADLTVVVVSSTGCEPAAIIATAEGGTVLFFSMATSFQTAALTADGIGRDVRMLVGSGYTPDCGSWSLDLLRRTAPLRAAFGLAEATS
ncbi:MAG: L-erythro-3,5-diaminohexanoate dehydrogenase [Solirubrobacterales bacterium]|nr:L-erythro-3,5-diaminohexanoate dehydrogenase [Solirubrobacterales bacterium]MCB0859644.1 L-erythro-3,5-diaminohexanoate dehydrogenase [Solirubrobacterales bacterium]HRV59003.1 L-erythro-3,5-diaminohexanoate dehydrogenase [Solirubrobacterales bacterium]